MTWTYRQRDGALIHDGEVVAHGYSGFRDGKNNPDDERIPGKGPLPRGQYTFGAPHASAEVGPYAMSLTPKAGTDTFGRSAFLIHGDSVSHPGEASHGCIILSRAIREEMWMSDDRELEVV